MKVAMISPYPLRTGEVTGGVEGVCYYLVDAIRKMENIEIDVIVPNAQIKGISHSYDELLNDVRVHALVNSSKMPLYYKATWQTPRILQQELDHIGCDVVHYQGVARWSGEETRPHVVTLHGFNERDTLFRGNPLMARLRSWSVSLTEGRARRNIPNVIAINPYVRSFFKPSDRQRVWDIPNPVADSFFEIPRDPEPGRVFSAGSIIPRKNQLGLLQAFAKVVLDLPQAELRIAGTGIDNPYGKRCMTAAKELGIASRVSFLDSLSVGQIQEELRRAHCMVLPSLQETAPLSISEAMAAGVPVVASNICGIPWMLDESVTGRLVDPTNYRDIARGLLRVLLTDDVAVMGATAKRIAKERFSASLIAKRTVEVYKELLT